MSNVLLLLLLFKDCVIWHFGDPLALPSLSSTSKNRLFNRREREKERERPIGLKANEALAESTSQVETWR